MSKLMSREDSKRKLWAMKKVSAEGKTECDALIDEMHDNFEATLESLKQDIRDNVSKRITAMFKKA